MARECWDTLYTMTCLLRKFVVVPGQQITQYVNFFYILLQNSAEQTILNLCERDLDRKAKTAYFTM